MSFWVWVLVIWVIVLVACLTVLAVFGSVDWVRDVRRRRQARLHPGGEPHGHPDRADHAAVRRDG